MGTCLAPRTAPRRGTLSSASNVHGNIPHHPPVVRGSFNISQEPGGGGNFDLRFRSYLRKVSTSSESILSQTSLPLSSKLSLLSLAPSLYRSTRSSSAQNWANLFCPRTRLRINVFESRSEFQIVPSARISFCLRALSCELYFVISSDDE